MVNDVQLTMKRFRRGGGKIEIDQAGNLLLTFRRLEEFVLGDRSPDFKPWNPPWRTPDSEMDKMLAYLREHTNEVIEIFRNQQTWYVSLKNPPGFSGLGQQFFQLRLDFMRRDPQFHAAYSRATGLRKQAGFLHVTPKYLKTPEGQLETELCDNFDLTPPFPPPDLDKPIKRWISEQGTNGTQFTLAGKSFDDLPPYQGFTAQYREGTPHRIKIDIDLSRVNSLPTLIDRIHSLLKTYVEDSLKPNSLYMKAVNVHPARLEMIRDAGEAYGIPGATYDTVIEELQHKPETFLNKGPSEADYVANREKVKHLLRAYRKLTEGGGWRKIEA